MLVLGAKVWTGNRRGMDTERNQERQKYAEKVKYKYNCDLGICEIPAER
jgi:hypothetical protein